jgi:hypothetical protein
LKLWDIDKGRPQTIPVCRRDQPGQGLGLIVDADVRVTHRHANVHLAGGTLRTRQRSLDEQFGIFSVGADLQGSMTTAAAIEIPIDEQRSRLNSTALADFSSPKWPAL